MPQPRLSSPAAGLLVLIALAAGWTLGKARSARLADSSPSAPPAASPVASAHAPERPSDPREPQASPVLAGAPARRSLPTALLKLLADPRSRFYLNTFSEDETRLSSEALAVLDISPEEKQQAERALAETREAMHRLCRANFKVVSQTKDQAELSLAPLPGGAALKKNLVENFNRILGEDRARVIFNRMDDTRFMGFGADRQTIKIEWKDDMVDVTHEFKDAKGQNRTTRGWTAPELPKLYEDILTRR